MGLLYVKPRAVPTKKTEKRPSSPAILYRGVNVEDKWGIKELVAGNLVSFYDKGQLKAQHIRKAVPLTRSLRYDRNGKGDSYDHLAKAVR